MSRELDEACARALGWNVERAAKAWSMEDWLSSDTPTERDVMAIKTADWKPGASYPEYEVIPHYSTDHAAAHLLEDEIERRGLRRPYVRALWNITECDGNQEGENIWMDEWKLIRATPEQRARAFLQAVEATVA